LAEVLVISDENQNV